MDKTRMNELTIGLIWFLVLIIVTTILILISWNLVMPELFGAVKMNFKNALGLVILIATVSRLIYHGLGGRHFWLPMKRPSRERLTTDAALNQQPS